MSGLHDHLIPASLRFGLDLIGATWCTVGIHVGDRIHEALVDCQGGGAIRSLLGAIIGLNDPEAAKGSLQGFTLESPSCRYRWTFRLAPRGNARIRIERTPDAFGRDVGAPVFDAVVSVHELNRQAHREVREVLIRLLDQSGGADCQSLPVQEFLRVQALVLGTRQRPSARLHAALRDPKWIRRILMT